MSNRDASVRRQREHFDRTAHEYDGQVARLGMRNHDRKMAELDRLLALESKDRVLEIGAGSGFHLRWLSENRPRLRPVGLDLSIGMLRQTARRAGSRRLVTGDAMRLPVRDGAFPAAFAVDVVHHVDDPVAMLREMARAVAPGGPVAVLEPNALFPVNLIYVAEPVEWGVFRSLVGNLRRWAVAAGWEDVRPVRLPIYFPPMPETLFPLYGAFERTVGSLRPMLPFSTTLGVAGRSRSTPAGGGSSGPAWERSAR